MNRFWQIIKWSLVTERKQKVKNLALFFVVYFVLIGACSGLFTGYRHEVDYNSILSASIMCSLVWLVASANCIADAFSNMRTKNNRIAYMMLPATNREKYITRIVIALVETFVAYTLMLVAADLLNMLLTQIFTGTSTSTFAVIIKRLTSGDTASLMTIIFIITGTIWSITAYILGGTIFRKAPFIWSTLAWNAIWTIVLLLGAGFFWLIKDDIQDYEIEFWWGVKFTFFLVGSIVSALFSVFNIWLSYRIYKRMDINVNKFLNV